MYVNIRCSEPCYVLILTHDDFKSCKEDNSEFEKIINLYQAQILKRGNHFPLDYIRKNCHDCGTLWDKKSQLENVLKNVVFRRIIKIREDKMKPKINKFLELFRDKTPMVKALLVTKIKYLYNNKMKKEEYTDKKFEKLIMQVNRIQQILMCHDEAY